MKKKVLPAKEFKSLNFKLILHLLLLIIFLGWQYYQYRIYKEITTTKPTESPKLFIAPNVPVSGESMVTNKIIAEKLNLARKIIVPKTANQVEQIKATIEEEGGQIIHAKPNLIVALVPQETEDKVKLKFEADKTVEVMEIDYPTFLATDNPDWGVTRIEAPQVWPTTTAEGLKIAVVDTGIDYNHQDLKARFAGGWDTYNEDSDPYDDHGHGTHVSGIISADLNDVGLAGVAPKASIYAIKALDSNGTGYVSDIVEAIDWAMNHGAQVINFSLGSYSDSLILRNKINEAAGKGIYLVAAAGNTYGGPLLYPAAYSSVISVAATDNSDRLAYFSSLGAEIAAPGVAVTSSVPGNTYATWSGTSMAAPHVTATVALMIANKQTNIRENLHNTAIDLGPAGKDSYFGYGLVHAKPAALGEDKLAPVVTFLTPDNNSQVSGEVKVELNIQDENSIIGAKLFIDDQLVKEWTQEPYTYVWDTNKLASKQCLLLAQALDNSNNLGEAKITVTVTSLSPSPSFSLKPSPTGSASASPISSTKPVISAYPDRGRSGDNRQDINTPAEEHRQNYENWPGHQKDKVPDITNIYYRNPLSPNVNFNFRQLEQNISEPLPSADKKTGDKKSEKNDNVKDKKVKGVYSEAVSLWQKILEFLGF